MMRALALALALLLAAIAPANAERLVSTLSNTSIQITSSFAGEVLTMFAVGMVVSAIVGYVTIKYFLRFLARHRLDLFAWYRLALAALTVVWLWRH